MKDKTLIRAQNMFERSIRTMPFMVQQRPRRPYETSNRTFHLKDGLDMVAPDTDLPWERNY